MADYISQLNGEQMDAALMDVALHNSEAWAVGTRNGYDVEQGDATYHNNAKYYAQVAQSAIPGTYTAAVRWDIAQGLAGEAQEQARANISAGASNRNLLDNPWFTVNQRGFTTGISGSGLTVDRWRSDNANISLSNGVISIPANATFKQIIDTNLYNFLVGKTVTLSCMLSDGTIQSGTVVVPSTGSTYAPNTPRLALNGSNKQFHIYPPSAVSIKAFKLELGAYSTLANDVPPDYGTELLKCMRYFIRLGYTDTGKQVGFGYMYSTTQARILVPTPVTMRANPTVTPTNLGGAFRVNAGGTYLTPSSASATATALPNGVNINFGTSSAGTSGAIATVFSYGTGSIDLSADI